jgi:hypothetical protein
MTMNKGSGALFPFPFPFPTLLVATVQKGGCGQRGVTREKRPMVFRDAAAWFRSVDVDEKGPRIEVTV